MDGSGMPGMMPGLENQEQLLALLEELQKHGGNIPGAPPDLQVHLHSISLGCPSAQTMHGPRTWLPADLGCWM